MDSRRWITQVYRFLIVGSLAFGIDAGIYIAAQNHLGLWFAKWLSFVLATIFTYFCNKFWTFKSEDSHKLKTKIELTRFAISYVVVSLVNTGVNHEFFHLIGTQGAFLTATTLCMILNFLSLKFWVFKRGVIGRG